MYGYVYKTTDLRNNKIYIGQHKSEQYDDKYYGSGIIITSLIKKYGTQNFKNEILCECASAEELNDKEIEFIAQYDARNPEIGYNIATGGAFGDSGYHLGMLGKTQTDKQKACASKACSYKRDKKFCERMAQQTTALWEDDKYRELMSKKRKGKIPWNKGMTIDEETKEKISKSVSKSLKDKYEAMTDEEKLARGKAISAGKKGKVAVTDGNKTYFVSSDEVDDYIHKGYYKMSLQRYKKLNKQ